MYFLIIKLSNTEMIQEKISEAMCLERAAQPDLQLWKARSHDKY